MSPKFEAMSIRQRQDALIAALRSGEHKQGVGRLRYKSGEKCCLGVACCVAGLETELLPNNGWYTFSFDGLPSNSYIPDGAYELFGFHDWAGRAETGGTSLAFMNDQGIPFSTIADLLEPMDSPYWKRADPE